MTPPGHQITAEEYKRIGHTLRAKAGRFNLTAEELEEWVQETFLHAQKALNEGRFRGDSALDTWVVAIGKNRLGKLFRRKRAAKRDAFELPIDDSDSAQDTPSAPPLPSTIPDAEAVADGRQQLDGVRASLGRIDEQIRRPFLMSVEGHSTQEIADKLGISPSLVTSRVHQVRDKLRQEHGRGP